MNKKIKLKVVIFFIAVILISLFLYHLFMPSWDARPVQSYAITCENLRRCYLEDDQRFLGKNEYAKLYPERIKSFMRKEFIKVYYSPAGFELGDRDKWQVILVNPKSGAEKMRIIRRDEGRKPAIYISAEHIKDNSVIPPDIKNFDIFESAE